MAEPVPKLIHDLGDGRDATRDAARAALAKRGRDVLPAVLEAASHDPAWQVRQYTLAVVEDIGPDASMVDRLIAIVEHDQRGEVPDMAIRILGKLGPDAKKAVPLLEKRAAEDDGYTFTSRLIQEALFQIEPERQQKAKKVMALNAAPYFGGRGAMRVTIESLDDSDLDVRRAAFKALYEGVVCKLLLSDSELADRAWASVRAGLTTPILRSAPGRPGSSAASPTARSPRSRVSSSCSAIPTPRWHAPGRTRSRT